MRLFDPRPAPEIDLAGFVSRGVTTAPYRYQARITLHVSAAEAADRIPATVGVIEAVDATSCLLHTGLNSLDELAVYVGLFGFGFRVHEPPELIDHLRALAHRVTAAISPRAGAPGSAHRTS